MEAAALGERRDEARTPRVKDEEEVEELKALRELREETFAVPATSYRNFFDRYDSTASPPSLPSSSPAPSQSSPASRMEALMSFLSSDVVGCGAVLDSPFGARPVVYADWTASGRAVAHVERFLLHEVLPFYANTHSTAAYSGLQTSLYRREARDLIAQECGAGKDDALLFAGSGCSGAVALLLALLTQQWREQGLSPSDVLFVVGPYQHHSVLLPLRELGCSLREVEEDGERGGVDVADLRRLLSDASSASFRVKVGVFSAASNVSGLLSDTEAVAAVCHECGALNVWDYATAAPYVAVDMNPRRQSRYAKDAVFLSPHKLLGGPSTPGVLLVKKRLLLTERPSLPAGGTVFFVSPLHTRYLQNFEEREEGGTPDIVGAIRAGLAFQLRAAVDPQWKAARLASYTATVMRRLKGEDSLLLLGNAEAPRLPIFSFLVRHPGSGLYLHPSFVSALLNDLFGVQTRSGCMCAAPYAFQCLGLSPPVAKAIEAALMRRQELLRPGFTRLSLHPTMSEDDVAFIADALCFVARDGWRLLALYHPFADSGEWKHRQRLSRMKDRRWLAALDYSAGAVAMRPLSAPVSLPSLPLPALRRSLFEAAAAAVASVTATTLSTAFTAPTVEEQQGGLDAGSRHLRWFLLPSEALLCAREPQMASRLAPAFLALRPPQSLSELRRVRGEWRAKEAEETKEAPPPSPGSPAELETAGADGLRGDSGDSPSLLSSIRAFQDAAQLQRRQRRAKASRGAADTAGEAEVAANSLPPAASPPAAATGLGPVCRHCFHRHWAVERRQCPACSCVSFEPLPPPNATQASQSSNRAQVQGLRSPVVPSSPPVPLPSASTAAELSRVTRKLRSLVGRAIQAYSMIGEGDRVLVGVSGGKDSLTLLHILLALRAKSPVKFELGAVTVDPQTPEYNPAPLKAYFAAMQLPYFYESQPIIEAARSCMLTPATTEQGKGGKVSICAFCARMKRGMLYSALRREGWNVLALGQHADDLCESLLMSAFHNGLLRTMKANYRIGAGDLRVIRPLVFVRERMTRQFAQLADLPVIFENCLPAGTLVNLADGTSRPIEAVRKGAHVLSYAAPAEGQKEGLVARKVEELLDRGLRACVELLFSDGRTLTCTPDHLIRTVDGRWMAAGDLVVGRAEVAVGVEFPNSLAGAVAVAGWRLDTRAALSYDLDMRERAPHSLAFARLLGYVLTDGSVGEDSELKLGHQLDAEAVLRDVDLLTGRQPMMRQGERTLDIWLPASLHRAFLAVGVEPGARKEKVSHFPAFVMQKRCPLPIVREFLGGLFGGDGHTIALSHLPRQRNVALSGLGWACVRSGDVAAEQMEVLERELYTLLRRCGVDCTSHASSFFQELPPNTLTGEGRDEYEELQAQGLTLGLRRTADELEPEESYTVGFRFGSPLVVPFASGVGFRHCCHKQQRLAAAVAYYRTHDRHVQQRRQLSEFIVDLRSEMSISIPKAAVRAKEDLAQREQLLPITKKWKPKDTRDLRVTTQTRGGPSALKQLQAMRCLGFFSAPRTRQRYSAARQAELAVQNTEAAASTGDDTASAERVCVLCGSGADGHVMLLCDTAGCNDGYHIYCLEPPLPAVPPESVKWFCPPCSEESEEERFKRLTREAEESCRESKERHANVELQLRLRMRALASADAALQLQLLAVRAVFGAAAELINVGRLSARSNDRTDAVQRLGQAIRGAEGGLEQLCQLLALAAEVHPALIRGVEGGLEPPCQMVAADHPAVRVLQERLSIVHDLVQSRRMLDLGVSDSERDEDDDNEARRRRLGYNSSDIESEASDEDADEKTWAERRAAWRSDHVGGSDWWPEVSGTAERGWGVSDGDGHLCLWPALYTTANDHLRRKLRYTSAKANKRLANFPVVRLDSSPPLYSTPDVEGAQDGDDDEAVDAGVDVEGGEEGQRGEEGQGGDEAADPNARSRITYGVPLDARALPLFRVRLVGRRDVGQLRVYDLSVPSPQGEDTRSFTANGVVVHNCPACFEPPKERQRLKELLAQEESRHSNVVSNLLTAMQPLMSVRSANGAAAPDEDDEDA